MGGSRCGAWAGLLLFTVVGGCGNGLSGEGVRTELPDADVHDAQVMEVPDVEPGPDGDGCRHMACSYLAFHYAAFELDYEDCKRMLAGATGCTTCCRLGPGEQMVASEWCCPRDEEPDAWEAADADAEG